MTDRSLHLRREALSVVVWLSFVAVGSLALMRTVAPFVDLSYSDAVQVVAWSSSLAKLLVAWWQWDAEEQRS